VCPYLDTLLAALEIIVTSTTVFKLGFITKIGQDVAAACVCFGVATYHIDSAALIGSPALIFFQRYALWGEVWFESNPSNVPRRQG